MSHNLVCVLSLEITGSSMMEIANFLLDIVM